MTAKLIAHLKEYFLMAKTIKLLTKEQYKEYKSRVNAYERNWRNTHKDLHKKNSEKLLSAIKQPKKKVVKAKVVKKKVEKKIKIAPKKKIQKKLKDMVEIPKATDAENQELESENEKMTT